MELKLTTDYKATGVIVARFQVPELHVEHKALIDKVMQYHKKVFVFLGTSPVKTNKNPLDYPTRVRMILDQYPTISVLPISDVESDKQWAENLDAMIKSVEPTKKIILYGGRDSFSKFYKPFGKFETVELASTFDISGSEVREAISNEVLSSSDFRSGQIYQLENRFPIVYPTVDVIITRNFHQTNGSEMEFLLGKKHAEVNDNKWRIVGGFIEKRHNGGKNAAIAEVEEETNLDISKSIINYVGQYNIDDWRYRGTKDGIMTTVFHVDIIPNWMDKSSSNTEKAGDDLAEIKWFKRSEVMSIIRDTHREIMSDFLEKNK
jgi:bifunctional NMN adenylyltransferase/nudix hydrolase